MTLDPDTDLKLERVVDAPRDLLWLCWTTPDHIKNFFIPAPHKVIDCDLDLRVGGRFNTIFEVDGQRMDNRGVFLEIDPGNKLVFTDGYTEGWKPAEKPFMTAILLLEDVGEGKTRYTAIARHPTKEIREQHEQMGFHEGWGVVLDQLVGYVKSLQPLSLEGEGWGEGEKALIMLKTDFSFLYSSSDEILALPFHQNIFPAISHQAECLAPER